MTDNISIPHIAIIGAGQLGSRHLQGLTKINRAIKITIVEPNSDARMVAKKRYDKMPVNQLVGSVNYLGTLKDLKQNLDLAIISTNADIRRKVIESLLNNVNVKYLILEKVAFQSIQDFEFVIDLLEKKNVKAWVNCPRRMAPFFRDLQNNLKNQRKLVMHVEGSNWGLASNAIHMLDLMAFFTGRTKFTIVTKELDLKIYESKRAGFIELGGKFKATTQDGDTLILIDNKNGHFPFKICIESASFNIDIFQQSGLAKIVKNGTNKTIEQKPFYLPFQSELTNLQVQQILDLDKSELTPIGESFILHNQMISSFNKHLKLITQKDYSSCPIT